jgi:hypothetical protein
MTPPTCELRRYHTVLGAKSQFDVDHIGPDEVRRRLIKDLAIVHLPALIAQEAEADQTKAEEVAPKDFFEVLSADDEQKKTNQSRNLSRQMRFQLVP